MRKNARNSYYRGEQKRFLLYEIFFETVFDAFIILKVYLIVEMANSSANATTTYRKKAC